MEDTKKFTVVAVTLTPKEGGKTHEFPILKKTLRDPETNRDLADIPEDELDGVTPVVEYLTLSLPREAFVDFEAAAATCDNLTTTFRISPLDPTRYDIIERQVTFDITDEAYDSLVELFGVSTAVDEGETND